MILPSNDFFFSELKTMNVLNKAKLLSWQQISNLGDYIFTLYFIRRGMAILRRKKIYIIHAKWLQ